MSLNLAPRGTARTRLRWRPVRSASDRVVAGLAGGLAEQLQVDAVVVRLSFVVLAFAGGFGVVFYLLGWLFGTDGPPAAAPRSAPADGKDMRPTSRSEPERLLSVALVVGGALLVCRSIGLWLGDGLVWPVAVAAFGSAVIWTRHDGPGHERLARVASRLPKQTVDAGRDGRVPRTRIVVGGSLVLAGMVSLLAANATLAAARVARSVAFAILVTVSGLGLILGPWVWRLIRQLGEERRERIRSEERSEVAAHLHDSVLQTLALIQRSSSPPEMVSLARGQERELRTWLYGRTQAGRDAGDSAPGSPNGTRLLSEALDDAAGRVERLHHVPVETVVVGDVPVDERLRAMVDAAGEAMSNAAKHSGAASISVYAEVGDEAVNLYVRDEGRGFDTGDLPADRRGIRESIVGRMERHGGVATLASESDEGTEVHLRMPRRDA